MSIIRQFVLAPASETAPIFVVVGAQGSGKTSLLASCARMVRGAAGGVRLIESLAEQGVELQDIVSLVGGKRRVRGFVPQLTADHS